MFKIFKVINKIAETADIILKVANRQTEDMEHNAIKADKKADYLTNSMTGIGHGINHKLDDETTGLSALRINVVKNSGELTKLKETVNENLKFVASSFVDIESKAMKSKAFDILSELINEVKDLKAAVSDSFHASTATANSQESLAKYVKSEFENHKALYGLQRGSSEFIKSLSTEGKTTLKATLGGNPVVDDYSCYTNDFPAPRILGDYKNKSINKTPNFILKYVDTGDAPKGTKRKYMLLANFRDKNQTSEKVEYAYYYDSLEDMEHDEDLLMKNQRFPKCES